jgi:hypothetical protein
MLGKRHAFELYGKLVAAKAPGTAGRHQYAAYFLRKIHDTAGLLGVCQQYTRSFEQKSIPVPRPALICNVYGKLFLVCIFSGKRALLIGKMFATPHQRSKFTLYIK